MAIFFSHIAELVTFLNQIIENVSITVLYESKILVSLTSGAVSHLSYPHLTGVNGSPIPGGLMLYMEW